MQQYDRHLQVLPYPVPEEPGLERVLLEPREVRSRSYQGMTGLADKGMMMGLGKRVIADKG